MKFEVALYQARSVIHTVQAGMTANLKSLDPDEVLLLLGSGAVCVFGFIHWVRRLQSVSNLGCHPLHRTPIYAALSGRFDNRSISFTTDFPSATFMAAHGIRRALLIQSTGDQPQPDLAHTLRRWQDGGIAIALKALDASGPPFPIEVRKPSGFGFLWHRALRMLGLRRHRLGGFGGFVPEPSAG
jgi:hypothetical protein